MTGKYKIINITSLITECQAQEVLNLFNDGYDIYREYVFSDNAVIILIKKDA